MKFNSLFNVRIWFLLVALALAGTSRAADFVDDINNASGARAEGHRVIYEMNVGSFTQAGTFAAATAQLENLKALGVDIVWLMPIYPRGGGINSPYAATNFQAVNPSYGTIADLKAFVTKAHSLNMLVWLDWVPNHTATNADWVTSHPEYYTKSNGSFVHPNNYSDVYQLNYSSTALVNAMNDCLKFWIDQADVDGYRCDYISSSAIPTSYWQSTIPMIKSYKAGKTISFLGEADIAQDATRLKEAGFDYDYAWAFQSQLASFGPSGTSASTLKSRVNSLVSVSSSLSFGRMLYLTNHDQNYNDGGRTLTTMYGDNRYALTVLAYTAYGMPLIYNGQETGGNQILDYFNDTKINWNTTDNKMRNTLRTLTALKHSQEALIDYKTPSKNPAINWLNVSGTGNSNVLAYSRTNGSSQVLVVLNTGTSAASVTLSGIASGTWSMWLNSQTVASGVSRTDVTLNSSTAISVEAKGYRVYVKGEGGDDNTPDTPITNLTDNSYCSVFYECPEEATICVWLWNNDKGQFTANGWPGDQLTKIGTTEQGKVVYKYELNIGQDEAMPTDLIFTKNGSDEANKTFTGEFLNHGYYIEGEGMATTTVPVETTVTEHEVYLAGEVSNWTTSDDYKFAYDSKNDVYTLNNVTLTALKDWEAGVPKFKVIDDGVWYGYNGEITKDNSTVTLVGTDETPNAAIAEGTYSFTYSATTHSLTVTGFTDDTTPTDVVPEGLTDNAYCSVFYECPEEATICVWLWNDNKGQFTAAGWPGDQLTKIGTTEQGKVIYKYELNIGQNEAMPTDLIFTKNGSADANKTFTGMFLNHGYYIEGEGMATTTVPVVKTLSGTVVDEQGKPLELVTVTATAVNAAGSPRRAPAAGTFTTTTATDGTFTLEVPADTQFTITLEKQGYDSVTLNESELSTRITMTESVSTVIDNTAMSKTAASVKYVNLMGVESDKPFKGMNIIVTTYTDGSKSTVKTLK